MHTFTMGTDVPNLRDVTLNKVVWCNPDELDYYAPGARQHTDEHIDMFQRTIYDFNGALPIVTNGTGGIIAGYGRVEASKLLGIDQIPTIPLSWLTEKERKHYIKTLMQFGEYVGWAREMLLIDLQHLKKYRLNTMAKINGRFFHANGKECVISSSNAA